MLSHKQIRTPSMKTGCKNRGKKTRVKWGRTAQKVESVLRTFVRGILQRLGKSGPNAAGGSTRRGKIAVPPTSRKGIGGPHQQKDPEENVHRKDLSRSGRR